MLAGVSGALCDLRIKFFVEIDRPNPSVPELRLSLDSSSSLKNEEDENMRSVLAMATEILKD